VLFLKSVSSSAMMVRFVNASSLLQWDSHRGTVLKAAHMVACIHLNRQEVVVLFSHWILLSLVLVVLEKKNHDLKIKGAVWVHNEAIFVESIPIWLHVSTWIDRRWLLCSSPTGYYCVWFWFL